MANCFTELGYTRGDEIALFMESRLEFVGIWLGLSKIGVVPALINSNLRMQPLAHSITVVNCKSVIFGSELLEGTSRFLFYYGLINQIVYFNMKNTIKQNDISS